ncbi:ORF6N domain-containing protein [Limnohabitans sp.]|uniref:ORF6N domain-containing protein n=1 Tax=Limnohabitans sp. TaxID=1907725 RepID=UPI00286EC4CF|nr:ORF6N domain-containing protein [Limnohabitans sp.]
MTPRLPVHPQAAAPMAAVESRIQTLRGQRVLLDADLAELYGVDTKVLNQAVKRNMDRFPLDFMFQLTTDEKTEVVTNCDHLAKLKFSKSLPFAFTEHGAIQAANVLSSPEAVQMGIYVVRAFVQMRKLSATHEVLAQRLDALEQKTEALSQSHDNLSQSTRAQLRQVIDTLRQLMTPPTPPKRPIGFTADVNGGKP